MGLKTTDLCDAHSEQLQIAEPIFRDFGGRSEFHGPILTLKLFEDNSLVRTALEKPGQGRVLVVDGGGSKRCALVGDVLAEMGANNDWAGAIVYGCVRDTVDLAKIAFGIKALAPHPLRSRKRGEGEQGIPVRFAGVTFSTGSYLYADPDGIVVAPHALVE